MVIRHTKPFLSSDILLFISISTETFLRRSKKIIYYFKFINHGQSRQTSRVGPRARHSRQPPRATPSTGATVIKGGNIDDEYYILNRFLDAKYLLKCH